MLCPHCKTATHLEIDATVTAFIKVNRDGEPIENVARNDWEWGDGSIARCKECYWEGEVHDLEDADPEPPDTDAPTFCQDCKQEVDEIRRTRRDGVQQCSACVLGEEGPQA